ncbi:MAG: hypothetical protein COZ16_01330 [Flavobacteriaceae bacterium CG_4_10_14_3_um_filter_31_253]|nr:MAG: hypothetical protein AUK46_07395 [Flavobacteriaceae bacterium CG2_30_31_66]PIV97953.1 MAG: hypothetical protein COW43_00650 [Flavobacteriaceae bacterium CG17_big_fil_post_rev_8_21_14_2_50_31_13]PIX11357.1 MAG: hypothetical protein COZ74_14280 [Flavobacteriaceae bacterium CG_4_8_14_3_um_filter_31_8]PIY16228.1 MAG: hypothetical protein COZ16_01330 [Flavobacteriaceae bacterium CG_4_10_14_3_um_filter_31_253]PIZ11219.1 MAG: hypothetical protein COY55_04880 [Flavobacteriaceae bacterium CG_4_1
MKLLNKKLNILFLCSWYPSKISPTNGDFIQRHAETVALRHNVTVLHIITDENLKTNKEIEYTKINEVEVYIGYLKKTNNPLLKWKRYFLMFKELTFNIKDFQLIHANILYPFGIFAWYLKMTKNIPYIISEHWTGFLRENSHKLSFFKKIIVKIICKKANFVCPVSEKLKEDMIFLGLNANYQVVGNVVDTSIFYPSEEKKGSRFQVVHVSNFNDVQKNITGLLKTAKKLETKIENFNFCFIGGDEKKIETIIKKLSFKNETLKFLGHLSQKELALELKKANLCISFSNYETFSIVPLEAISCGISVISTNTGILPELPQEDFFIIIPIADEEVLYNTVLEIYNNPPTLNIEEMHHFVENKFSKKAILSAFSDLYYKAIYHNDTN